jgi:hypothetical protein
MCFPLEQTFVQTVIIQNYFDENHGTRRMQKRVTRTARTDLLVAPLGQNKYHEITWHCIMPRLWNNLPNELKNA